MSSSSSKPQWIYDVFLSFRGEDTRRNFVSHLYAALSNAGVNTFFDDEKLDKGQMLPKGLSRAIEVSNMSLVVFSENNAGSSWCLSELEKIMECQRSLGQLVVPIFCSVDPSDVRRQRGDFGRVFDELAAKFSGSGMADKVLGWRRALTEAANLSGWDMRNFRSENEVVNKIVNYVSKKLHHKMQFSIPEFPVGLASRVHDVLQFLERESRGVRIIGIWGTGGIGKTTTAKAIYNEIYLDFENRSFIANIREVWEKDRGQTDLQEQLLSNILKTRQMKIHSIEWGKVMIKESLCSRSALVVLDDVNKLEQLDALCEDRKWFGPESLIIVTTRDVRLLDVLNADHIYNMAEMDANQSLKLFSWHAFREESPKEDFIELSKKVVAYCEGLPLALEVLGRHLYERTKLEWTSVLSILSKIPHNEDKRN